MLLTKDKKNVTLSQHYTQMERKERLLIDIHRIIRTKAPQIYNKLPGFLLSWIKNLIHQDDVNRLIQLVDHHQGSDAAKIILDDLKISYSVVGEENIPTDTRRLTFVSNHPLGGLDGIVFIHLLGKRYADRCKLLVNDVLMNLRMFDNVFVPINKYGKQAKAAATKIKEAYESDNVVHTFPSGLVSRLQRGTVSDLTWKKNFIQKSIETRRTLIPVYFDGLNPPLFYRVARLRQQLGIRFNYELILLPKALFKSRGSHFTLYIGKPIDPIHFDNSQTADRWAEQVKATVYSLKHNG